MKMKRRRQWLTLICIVMFIGIGGAIYALTTSKNQVITETDVRNQLSSLYDAEVADVKKTKDVYKAVITKSGSAYLVEMNPKNGEIFSLQPTEELIIPTQEPTKRSNISTVQKEKENSSSTKPAPIDKQSTSKKLQEAATAREDKSVPVEESASQTSTANQIQENSTVENQVATQGLPKEEPPSATPSGETVNETTKSEASATNESKQPASEEKKEENISTESDKETVSDSKKETELTGQNSIKIATMEESKTKDIGMKITEPSTLYISKKKAIRIALDQYKGSFEKMSFEKKVDGGYYLVTIKDLTNEKESKENQKATVQIHAISGKILSVTWE